MAKNATNEREKALELTRAQIEKQFGKGSIMCLGDNNVFENFDAVSTGSLGLDIALGIGGLPKGRVVEIYGPEGSGKTTVTVRKMVAWLHSLMQSTPWIRYMPANWV